MVDDLYKGMTKRILKPISNDNDSFPVEKREIGNSQIPSDM